MHQEEALISQLGWYPREPPSFAV